MRVKDDFISMGGFKTHGSRIVRGLREKGRPVAITQHGKPAGVLISPGDFDRFTDRERFVAAVEQGFSESEAGLGVDDEELGAELDRELGPLDPS